MLLALKLIKVKLDKAYLNPEIDLSLAANQLEPLPSIMTLEPIPQFEYYYMAN